MITASADGTARIWELTPAEVPVPTWVLDLAEAAVGQRLTDEEAPESVPVAQFLELKKKLSEMSDADSYTAWAKWFLADRLARTTSLSSGITVNSTWSG